MPDTPDADRQQLEALEEELRAARQKRDTYQGLLRELPEVFEGKFRERLRPVQQRNEQLLQEGLALRDQIRRALPQAGEAGRLPAATAPAQAQAGGDQGGPAAPPSAAPASRASGEELLQRLRSLLPPERRQPALAAAVLAAAVGLLLGSAVLIAGRQRSAPQPSRGASGSLAADTTTRTGGGDDLRPGSNAGRVQEAPGDSRSGPALLSVRTIGPSWIEVRGPAGELLFSDELNGVRSFPLARGLSLRSGRADLVRIRVNGGEERTLGSVADIGWKRFAASGSAATTTQPGSRP